MAITSELAVQNCTAVETQIESEIPNDQLIGQSVAFESVVKTIQTVAPRQCPVIILGETGTGKEMAARQIHLHSRRAHKVFIPVDCTSLAGQLFESQLFGHVKGSFTGATGDTLGFFRAADNGTIFLDEIGELSLELQAKLLRVLQESRVTPLGSTKSYPINVRVVCATNRDLRKMVQAETFRADLYFRLNVVQLELPPLRQRTEDIAILSNHFLEKQAQLYDEPVKTLSKESVKILASYKWPGNVRELANVMEHAYVISDSNVIKPSALPSDILTGSLLPQAEDDFPSMDDMNKKLVLRALQAVDGKKMAAAKLLKIDHRKLERYIKKYELSPTWK